MLTGSDTLRELEGRNSTVTEQTLGFLCHARIGPRNQWFQLYLNRFGVNLDYLLLDS